jgi:hypothetical protein
MVSEAARPRQFDCPGESFKNAACEAIGDCRGACNGADDENHPPHDRRPAGISQARHLWFDLGGCRAVAIPERYRDGDHRVDVPLNRERLREDELTAVLRGGGILKPGIEDRADIN